MRKIAIVTDSNSGITQDEGKKAWNLCSADALFILMRLCIWKGLRFLRRSFMSA